MKNNRQNEMKVIVNGEPDLSPVPESLMDAFIAAIVEEISKLNNDGSDKAATELWNTKNG